MEPIIVIRIILIILLALLYYLLITNESLRTKIKEFLLKLLAASKIQQIWQSTIKKIKENIPGNLFARINKKPKNIQATEKRNAIQKEKLQHLFAGILKTQKYKITFGNNNPWKFIIEWAAIAAWSLWIGKAYLGAGMALDMWPNSGKEYIMSMQNQYVWPLLLKCGTCFFWNGYTNGGAPSFTDLLSGWLHPISSISTLVFGVFNSGKIIFIASIFMAGMGQWWLAKILKLSTIPRMWMSLALVASGSIVGRMEIGSAPLVQSVAACSLIFPAILQMARHASRKNAIILGIISGLAALSGQSYIQMGLILCVPPMIASLITKIDSNGGLRITPNWRYFAFATIIGLLIAAPLLVTLVNTAPYLRKATDPSFSSAQPLEYIFLNLVIHDLGFYYNETLGKLPYPHLNVNYLGWFAVICAILGITLSPNKQKKIIIAICIALVFIYLTSSAILLKWIQRIPFGLGELMSGMRGPAQIQGLAGSLILALAGIGAEKLIKREWPQIKFNLLHSNQTQNPILRIDIKWVVLFFFMANNLYTLAEFSKNFVYVDKIKLNTNALIQPLKTPNTQWVQPPFGEYVWLPAAIENNLKITDFFRPWRISVIDDNLPFPDSYLQMSNIKDDEKRTDYLKTVGEYVILHRPKNFYASVSDRSNVHPCTTTTSIGGFIDVTCTTSTAGKLTVLENALNGWYAMRDGQSIPLLEGKWLTVNAPAGKHTYSFRYIPWDASLGILLAIIGWGISIFGLLRFSQKEKPYRPLQQG